MIKICYVIGTLNIGGTEKQLLILVKGLDKKRFLPVVISLRKKGHLKKDFEASGIKVIEIGKRFKIDIAFFFKLFNVIKKEKPVIVHTFLFTSNTWGRIAAILNKTPLLISSEQCVDSWKKWHHILIDKILLYFTKIVTVNSYAVKNFYQKSEHIPEPKIRVIHNGTEIKSTNTQNLNSLLNKKRN